MPMRQRMRLTSIHNVQSITLVEHEVGIGRLQIAQIPTYLPTLPTWVVNHLWLKQSTQQPIQCINLPLSKVCYINIRSQLSFLGSILWWTICFTETILIMELALRCEAQRESLVRKGERQKRRKTMKAAAYSV